MIRMIFFLFFFIQTNVFGMGYTGGSIGYIAPNPNDQHGQFIEKRLNELEDERRAKKILHDLSNKLYFVDKYQIREEKKSDLRSINAILKRYKNDFLKIRNCSSCSLNQDLKYKIFKIFKSNLVWEYTPTNDLMDLIVYLHKDLHSLEMSQDEKISLLKNRITEIKKKLIWMRNYCIKKKETPPELFSYLMWLDIALEKHKYEKNWEKYNMVLKLLDEDF